MNNRWATLVAAALVAFASLVITWQVRHCNESISIAQACIRGELLAKISDIVERDSQIASASGRGRHFDLVLPNDARVFMSDMTGPTNNAKMMYYFFYTYYLFPREVGTSLDHKTRIDYNNGFLGTTSESDSEILSNGYNVRFDILSWDVLHPKGLKVLALRPQTNPDWFNSNSDTAIAFLLPLLTALTGAWLLRFLFSALSGQMPLLEQLACGLGLGMMAVAALTLGVKLCGFSGRGLILMATTVGAVAEIWRGGKILLKKITAGCWKIVHSPLTALFAAVGLLVFLILFRLAGLQGVTENDAVQSWLLKAKIMHLYHGKELVQWFSNPRLARALLDYPTLVPSLHAATYDSLGHVDEFVTKFWPVWMLLFLIGALASLNRAGNNWRQVSFFTLFGLLFLPATQKYVQFEGSTVPMIFFTVMGFGQCALWLIGKDRARLGLGLTLLFGAAMSKFEGFIFLALAGGWMLMLPATRPSLKPPPHFWRVLAFWLLAALPFVCLRIQKPASHFESGWAGYALQHPGITLSNWPGLFLILLARLFVSPDFANWSGEGERFHWIGQWDGFSSLYNDSTLGLAWLCLLLAVALWFAVPARRQVIVWILAMLIGTLIAFSGVFASLVNVTNLTQVIGYTADIMAGRYILPVLLAWFTTMTTMFFIDTPSAVAAEQHLPELKHSRWLALGAFLIMAFGIFVLPENEPASPENPLPEAAAASSLNSSDTNPANNPAPDLQTTMDHTLQLDKAGKFADAIQEFREAARLHPNDPVALNNLAWTLAANPRPELRNGREAVELAAKAVELTGRQQPSFIGTLAAAYAQAGQFAKAVETAGQARDLALSLHQPEVAAANEQLMKRYSAGKAVGSTNGP